MGETPPEEAAAESTAAWAPLADPVFRMLWVVWIAANTCMWMNDVAAAWLMTTLVASPVMVALVQTASTMPVFLLGLPSGALADILDRRRYFVATQFWVAGTASILSLAIISDAINPTLLLLLTFLNGIGLAMRWPVYSAIVPELVSRAQLPAALALNGVATNASRIIGPVVAGALIAGIGTEYVFVLNAVLSVIAGFLILRWKSRQKPSALPGERFLGAIRVGAQYVRQSSRMRAVLLRVTIFFAQSTALIALLPLVARDMPGGSAGTFTLLLASLGFGAILSAFVLPHLRQSWTRDDLVRVGSWVQAVAMVAVGYAPNLYVAVPMMVVSGAAWLTVANSIAIAAQLALPDWVRARGMSTYQVALMGGSGLGAAVWGQVAAVSNVSTSFLAAALAGTAASWLTRRYLIEGGPEEDLTPSQSWKAPVAGTQIGPDDGPVLTTIEYRIDPARAEEFRRVMQESRRSRLRQGALSWELFRDANDPGRYLEYFVDESWVEHLRRFDRVTASDVTLRARRLAFHLGPEPPVVTRCIAEPLGRQAL
ncbi:MAG: MFS transporter [Burkholderiales bacterium]|nr:MFS transporter [Burkholderiales bacterium]OJX00846.1 MAG: arabinose ABC transporter permease [Burkholderiales bacterium 70-64]